MQAALFAVAEALWAFANSPLGIAAISALAAYLLGRLFTAKPIWQRYAGAIIEAIKMAEREIPDDAEHKSIRRLNAALAWVLKIYHEAEGRMPSPRETEALKDGIRAKHADLEATGVLHRPG